MVIYNSKKVNLVNLKSYLKDKKIKLIDYVKIDKKL